MEGDDTPPPTKQKTGSRAFGRRAGSCVNSKNLQTSALWFLLQDVRAPTNGARKPRPAADACCGFAPRRSEASSLLDGDVPAERGSLYSSRLDRARAHNKGRRMSDVGSETGLGLPHGSVSSGIGSPAVPPGPPPLEAIASEMSTLVQPSASAVGAHWAFSAAQRRLAVVDATQLLQIIDASGRLEYRVQLPVEGTTVFIGWAPGGSVLAAVQKLGGAFLWFPARPENVQQWEGMQFSTTVLKGSLIKRNSHFDTCFASWSASGKLVLGLTDGNFAVWDLGSNETFMSRKHFAGKHKDAITCGDWGPRGETLALGSANQLKVSQPLHYASWEETAAKLHVPAQEESSGGFQSLFFSPSGSLLAAFAGASVFRHLCIYAVLDHGRKGSELSSVGKVHTLTPAS